MADNANSLQSNLNDLCIATASAGLKMDVQTGIYGSLSAVILISNTNQKHSLQKAQL